MKRFTTQKAHLVFVLILSVFIFVTGATAAGPTPVNLGTAGSFVILTKTGVTTTGTTTVVGDIGVSPIAATAITGFGLIADSSNTFSTSSLVTGKIYAADYASPTPAKMTTAISDMETAFTDAAGRSTPDFTELGAGDISGLTLAPGLYKWGTGVLITDVGVTLSGGANDVWIFQIAGILTVSNSAIITLIGGAQAKNIFWQVSGQATLGTTADFQGIILSQTLISMNTGAKMNGRALAQTAVTLIANTITAPAITAPPTLLVVKSADKASVIPGDVITYTVIITNSGSGIATSVVVDDHLSPYVQWGVNSYGEGAAFQFLNGAPTSGLALGTPVYSNDNGSTWVYTPSSPPGYDGNVTNWRLPMNGTMNANGANFTINYKMRVK